jgi:hypothetical protein
VPRQFEDEYQSGESSEHPRSPALKPIDSLAVLLHNRKQSGFWQSFVANYGRVNSVNFLGEGLFFCWRHGVYL